MNCSIIFSFCCSVDVCCITILAPHNNFRWLSLFLCTCFIRTIVNAWVKQAFTPASFEVICQPPSIQFRRLNFGGLTCISFWFGVQHYHPFMLFQEFFFWICLCISLPLWCFSPSNLSRTPSDCALESHQGTKFHWSLTLLHMSLFWVLCCWQGSGLFGLLLLMTPSLSAKRERPIKHLSHTDAWQLKMAAFLSKTWPNQLVVVQPSFCILEGEF